MAARSTQEVIRAALSRPESYSHHPDTVEVRETHISWVFLAGPLAFKLKKPLELDFVDYGTPERRRAMCAEEIRLNRRLAPELYLGVRGVALTEAGVELTSAGDPRAVDYVVEMRRYDEGRTLGAALQRGELELALERIPAVAGRLARFHADAPRAHVAEPLERAVERRFERNVHELLPLLASREEIGRVLALERFTRAFLTAHAASFAARAQRGCVRDGHGDLRCEHVLLDGDVQIVDCVEFEPGFREIDVADDLAFLVFDLIAHGGRAAADALLRSYREAGGDAGDDALVAFYALGRALVRAKVALVRAAQLPPDSAERARRTERAQERIRIAERFAWQARQPLLIVVCGLPASGKSLLAASLAQASGLPHISSDEVRKQLAGVPVTERAPAGSYSPEWNARTYETLGRLAGAGVADRGGAIVDATFRHAADRRAFAGALGAAPAPLFIECRAPVGVLAKRAAAREADPERISDADAAVVEAEIGSWEPLDEVPAGAHLPLRTDRPLDEVAADVTALLDQRLLDRG